MGRCPTRANSVASNNGSDVRIEETSPGNASRTSAPTFGIRTRTEGRYQIIGEHGRGGLGRVSRARDQDLQRDVALKELISQDKVSQARFQREALLTARLEHPNIVPVYEAGRWPDGTPFYAMKLVAGRPLRDLLRDKTVEQRIPLLQHVMAVADAIAYAHSQGIIHRDLKPANVIIGDFGETIVIDWGLAKDLQHKETVIRTTKEELDSDHDAGLTVDGGVLGTPAYMSPEQERGESVDQRADVFAIGAMLWEVSAVQKVPPNNARERHKLLRKAGIDQDLGAIIDKALDPDPARRYANAGDLAADLKSFVAGARIGARRYSLLDLLRHWLRRHRALTVTLFSAIVAVLVVVAVSVRNVTTERDRADAAFVTAERQRVSATAERDRAQLSEAGMLLERDPTRARELLLSIQTRGPQHGLLLARTKRLAASHTITFKGRVERVIASNVRGEVAIATEPSDLYALNVSTGEVRKLDMGLTGPLVVSGPRLCYARRSTNSSLFEIAGCDTAGLLPGQLQKPTSILFYAVDKLYGLEPSGELYEISSQRSSLVSDSVHGAAGSGRYLMICHRNGQLRIYQGGQLAVSTSCAHGVIGTSMAADMGHYAALRTPNQLISERGVIALPAPIHGQYEIVLGENGLIAVADFAGGGAWLVPPGALQVEAVANGSARPLSVAAGGGLVGFGYTDGSVTVHDVSSKHQWEFTGHSSAVTQIAIDVGSRRVVSASRNELRVWELPESPIVSADPLPCTPFNIVSARVSGMHIVDCSDGGARAWVPKEHQVRLLHKHHDLAFSATEFQGATCTGGWDGRVLCTPTVGGETRSSLVASDRIKVVVSCKDRVLLTAVADGTIWRLDNTARVLYRHQESPYRIAVDSSCKWMASGAYDGSLVVYDLLMQRKLFDSRSAHSGQITNLAMRGELLRTSSLDGTVRHWKIQNDNVLLIAESRLSGPVAKMQDMADGWVARVNENLLAIEYDGDPARMMLDLGHAVTDIAVRADEKLIAIAAVDEIILIDRERQAIASFRQPGSDFACVRFIDHARLAVCDTAAVAVLDVKVFQFETIERR